MLQKLRARIQERRARKLAKIQVSELLAWGYHLPRMPLVLREINERDDRLWLVDRLWKTADGALALEAFEIVAMCHEEASLIVSELLESA